MHISYFLIIHYSELMHYPHSRTYPTLGYNTYSASNIIQSLYHIYNYDIYMGLLFLCVLCLLFRFRLRLLCWLGCPSCHMYIVLFAVSYCQVFLLYLLVGFWYSSILCCCILVLLCFHFHRSCNILRHCFRLFSRILHLFLLSDIVLLLHLLFLLF